LRESEARFRGDRLGEQGILVYDRTPDGDRRQRRRRRIIGLPLDEMLGKPGLTSLLPCVRGQHALAPEDRPTRITVRNGKPLTGRVFGIVRADKSVTWLEASTGFLQRPGEREFYGIVSCINDITSRRNAEQALRDGEALHQTFRLAASGITEVVDGRFVRRQACADPRLCRDAGMTVKEVSYPEDRDVTDARACTPARSSRLASRSATCAPTAAWCGASWPSRWCAAPTATRCTRSRCSTT
jgi:hypothetical protein